MAGQLPRAAPNPSVTRGPLRLQLPTAYPIKNRLYRASKPCGNRREAWLSKDMAALAALGLKALIAAFGLAFLLFLVLLPTDKYERSSVPNPLAISDLEGRSVLEMMLTWGTVLAATLATLLLRRQAGRQRPVPQSSRKVREPRRA